MHVDLIYNNNVDLVNALTYPSRLVRNYCYQRNFTALVQSKAALVNTATLAITGGVLASVWSLSELTARASVAIMAAISVYILTNCYRGLLGQNIRIGTEEAT